jgi:hypothetical protein
MSFSEFANKELLLPPGKGKLATYKKDLLFRHLKRVDACAAFPPLQKDGESRKKEEN